MAEPIAVAFGAILVGITGVLLWAYLSFARMNPEIRRARMFIMSQRIDRFLLAFTLGFLTILAAFIPSLLGIRIPQPIGSVAAFVFLGLILYGAVEILLVANPVKGSSRRRPSGRLNSRGSP